MKHLWMVLGVAMVACGLARAAETPRFTNEDLPAEDAAPAAGAVTNEDLADVEGNLTFTEPGDDVSYENAAPRSRAAERREAGREKRLDELKPQYRKLVREEERIEAELPAAIDAAEREVGPGYVLVNGIPTAVVPYPALSMPAHEHLAKLEKRLAGVQADMDDIEDEAHRLGFGTPALVQR